LNILRTPYLTKESKTLFERAGGGEKETIKILH
jgi:hypothetical protein